MDMCLLSKWRQSKGLSLFLGTTNHNTVRIALTGAREIERSVAKVLVAKADNVISRARTHMVGGQSQLLQSCPLIAPNVL